MGATSTIQSLSSHPEVGPVRIPRLHGPHVLGAEGAQATYDGAEAVLEDAAQIPAYRRAQDVAIEKTLAALAATRVGATRPRLPDPRAVPDADR